MVKRKPAIGVIGGSEATQETLQIAYETGKYIANNNAILICGGLGGVMEASSKGAYEHGGTVVGIIPDSTKEQANPYVTIVIPTGMGICRNTLVVLSSDVIIAFPGKFGTLSEIGIALNLKKTIVYLPGTWDLKKIEPIDVSLYKEAFDAHSAVGLALDALRKNKAI
jgi:uncharacterized protein (TIGR00725 family)